MFKAKAMSVATNILKYAFKFLTFIKTTMLKTSGKTKPTQVNVIPPTAKFGTKYNTIVASRSKINARFFIFSFAYMLSPTLNATNINITPSKIKEKVIFSSPILTYFV